MPDIQLPKGEKPMCDLCDENDYDDDYEEEEETSMEDRWYDFYSWLDQLAGYECAAFVNAPRGDSAESDEADEFFQHIISSFKSDFEDGIDEDGVTDLQRRLATRDEAGINSRNAADSLNGHDVVVAATDMGLYEYGPLDEASARMRLTTVGVALHDVLWSKAMLCEQDAYNTRNL